MTLAQGEVGAAYLVTGLVTQDEELEDFLFTLGCYSGEKITLVAKTGKSYVIAVRDGRYNIDENLADAILVAE